MKYIRKEKEVGSLRKILVIEDEKNMNEIICEYLKEEGYEVYSAFDGEMGIDIIKKEKIDIAIIDIMLPKIDGYGVLKYIYDNNLELGTIMLTCLDDIDSQLVAFDLYADDYMTKPVEMCLLIKRIESLLRRMKKTTEEKGLVLLEDSYQVLYNGKEIKLTLSEYLILEALFKNKNRVLTRENLISYIYHDLYLGSDRVIDVHINSIRKKIPVKCIKTVIGVGYQYDI